MELQARVKRGPCLFHSTAATWLYKANSAERQRGTRAAVVAAAPCKVDELLGVLQHNAVGVQEVQQTLLARRLFAAAHGAHQRQRLPRDAMRAQRRRGRHLEKNKGGRGWGWRRG